MPRWGACRLRNRGVKPLLQFQTPFRSLRLNAFVRCPSNMSAEPIQYFNRYKQVVETEQIYGEAWLRWTYAAGLGRFALNLFVKRAFLSRYYGWKMSQRASAHRVLPFIVDYDLDVDEFAK